MPLSVALESKLNLLTTRLNEIVGKQKLHAALIQANSEAFDSLAETVDELQKLLIEHLGEDKS